MKNWVEISREHLTANYRLLEETAGPDTTVLAVIKADAYGHSIPLCAPVLSVAGAKWLGVTDATEGRIARAALTQAGVAFAEQPRILVMSEGLDEDADAALEHQLAPIVSRIEQLDSLARAARERRLAQPFGVHLEIDTGMARQGVAPGDNLDAVLRWFRGQNFIHLDGLMTHFASAEIAGSHQTAEQRARFEQALNQVINYGIQPTWIHAGNSSTIDNAAEEPLRWLEHTAQSAGVRSMVRSGLALYGYCLPIEREQDYTDSAVSTLKSRLQPVMTWKTRVTGIREVEPGTKIGYNGTFVAQHPMRLALLPIGYADGLRRELSATNDRPGGWVLFGHDRASIVGRVSMNLTIVDVTSIPSVQVGDEAVLLGDGVIAEDHALLAKTIPYEILCGVRPQRFLL